MKKSRKQRKLETARRLAIQEQKRIQERKKSSLDYETSDIIVINKYPDIHKNKIHSSVFKSNEIPTDWIMKAKAFADICKKNHRKPEHYIVKAAILDRTTGEIFSRDLATYHCDIRSEFKIMESDDNFVCGFLDNRNGFLTRSEAGEVAFRAGQCDEHYRNYLQSNGFKHIL